MTTDEMIVNPPMPVSYTHLDVYKRQVQFGAVNVHCHCRHEHSFLIASTSFLLSRYGIF